MDTLLTSWQTHAVSSDELSVNVILILLINGISYVNSQSESYASINSTWILPQPHTLQCNEMWNIS